LLNNVNKKIHMTILKEGIYHLHQFSLADNGCVKKGAILYPQRFMCGNPNTTSHDVDAMIEYVRSIGLRINTEKTHGVN
jgi:hypothetical protein